MLKFYIIFPIFTFTTVLCLFAAIQRSSAINLKLDVFVLCMHASSIVGSVKSASSDPLTVVIIVITRKRLFFFPRYGIRS